MAAESQVTPEAAPTPAAPDSLPPKALQAKQAASEQDMRGPSAAAHQGSSEASSADSNTSDAELPASDAEGAEGAEAQQPQDGVQLHNSTSDGQAEQDGHGPEAGGKAKQASGFALSASAASFVPGSGSAANGISSASNGGAALRANGHSGAHDAPQRGQRSDNTGLPCWPPHGIQCLVQQKELRPEQPCFCLCLRVHVAVKQSQQHAQAPDQAHGAGLCWLADQVSFVQVLKVESTGLKAGQGPMESTPMESTAMASLMAMATHMTR